MVTNDGATILKAIALDNAAAKVLVNISKVQDDEVGDGTTSVAVLAAELLREAEKLVDKKIHPQTIIDGYRIASRAALDLIDELELSNLALQLDVYHALRMNEDPVSIIREHAGHIGHIQIADVPGRHQPGTGYVDFYELFREIDESGYDGWVALEYIPEGPTEDGFTKVGALGYLGGDVGLIIAITGDAVGDDARFVSGIVCHKTCLDCVGAVIQDKSS